MHRLHYAGNSILTGTDIAHALLDYAQALAGASGSATVEIPTMHDDGTAGRSEILVGPASQLISDHEESDHEELVDEELVASLVEKAREVRLFGPEAPTAEPMQDDDQDWSADQYEIL